MFREDVDSQNSAHSPGISLPFPAGSDLRAGSLLAEPFHSPRMGILMTIAMPCSAFRVPVEFSLSLTVRSSCH